MCVFLCRLILKKNNKNEKHIFEPRKYPTELLLAGPVGDRHALNNLHVIFGFKKSGNLGINMLRPFSESISERGSGFDGSEIPFPTTRDGAKTL